MAKAPGGSLQASRGRFWFKKANLRLGQADSVPRRQTRGSDKTDLASMMQDCGVGEEYSASKRQILGWGRQILFAGGRFVALGGRFGLEEANSRLVRQILPLGCRLESW